MKRNVKGCKNVGASKVVSDENKEFVFVGNPEVDDPKLTSKVEIAKKKTFDMSNVNLRLEDSKNEDKK